MILYSAILKANSVTDVGTDALQSFVIILHTSQGSNFFLGPTRPGGQVV